MFIIQVTVFFLIWRWVNVYFVESVATTRKTLLYISEYTLHNLYLVSNAFCIFASLVINILQLYKTIIASWSPEKNNKFVHSASYGAQGKNILLLCRTEQRKKIYILRMIQRTD